MKSFAIILFSIFPLFSIAQVKSFQIKGKTKDVEKTAVAYLRYRGPDSMVVLSTPIKKGSFQFTGEISEPIMAIMAISHDGRPIYPTTQHEDFKEFYLDSEKIKVTTPDSIKNASISGSTAEKDYHLLKKSILPSEDSLKAIAREYIAATSAQKNDVEFNKAYRVKEKEAQNGIRLAYLNFIKEHPNSFMSIKAFEALRSFYPNMEDYENLYNTFPPNLKNTISGVKITEMIENSKKASCNCS